MFLRPCKQYSNRECSWKLFSTFCITTYQRDHNVVLKDYEIELLVIRKIVVQS